MPSFFLDSNVIMKRYMFGNGTVWIRETLSKKKNPASRIFISRLAQIEVASAIFKLERIARYDESFTNAALSRFEHDLVLSEFSRKIRIYEIVEVSLTTFSLAARLLRQYRSGSPNAIRSLDAIQLACAIQIRELLPHNDRASIAFVTSDRQLLGVARNENFLIIDPEHPPTP